MSRTRTRAFLYVSGVAVVALAVVGLVARLFASRVLGVQVTPDIQVRLPADRLFTVAGVPVTNTMLSCWLASLLLVAFFLAARWRARRAPRGFQNVAEALLEALLDLVQGAAGAQRSRYLFPIAATFFLFIVANAWIALLPLYGPVVAVLKSGEHVPLLRGAGTDINMSVALAVVAGVVVEGAGMATLGVGYFSRFLRVRSLLRGRIFLGTVELFTGLLDGFTELFRLLSFSLRLFGNLTAAEILLLVVGFLSPLILSVPFYGLELLIGAVQALVFAGLTVALTVVATTPEEVAILEEG